MNREEIIYLPTKDLKPYANNPRKNSGDAVEAVAASIKEFGFRSPIVIDQNGEIINGHTRWKAAKKLGIKECPCLRVEDLTEEQIKQFRLIDNKSAELSEWDADKLGEELLGMDFEDLDFNFDFTDDLKKRKKWSGEKAKCNLKDTLALRKCNDVAYHALFKTSKEGQTLEELKTKEHVPFFAETAIEFLKASLGENLTDTNWCILTTPRRRHKEGFHFSTEICRFIAEEIGITFYEDAFSCANSTRMDPIFNMDAEPKESNVIIYDDILTTGYTMQEVRRLLNDAGYTTFPLISVDNH